MTMWVAADHFCCSLRMLPGAVTSVSRQAVALNSRGVQAAKRSCAFKAGSGDPLYYPGYKQITWEDAPACNGQPPAGASVDSQVRWCSRAAALCGRTQPAPVQPYTTTRPKDPGCPRSAGPHVGLSVRRELPLPHC
jgi:hypothetical protein